MQRHQVLEKWKQPGSGNHWEKLGALASFVDDRLPPRAATSPAAGAAALLRILETFAQSREHWLKVAGGAKAEVLEHALSSRRWALHEVAVECGTFVGYSAARFAAKLWRLRPRVCRPSVVTLELDPIQACLARHFVDIAGLSALVEVSIGQARDLVLKLAESFGWFSVGFVFMDHKGSIFHTDLMLMERMSVLAPNSLEVADNVALPGAPLLLWHLAVASAWELTAYAMMEFHEPNTEDWMAVAQLTAPPVVQLPDAPREWQRLSWHTDHMRRRACGFRPTEGDMFEADRVAYSRYVRRHFKAAGIEAMPWTGPTEVGIGV